MPASLQPAPAVVAAVLALCECAGDPALWPRAEIAACEDWSALEAAAGRHGLQSLLFPAPGTDIGEPGALGGVPAAALGGWKRHRIVAAARILMIHAQLRELAAAFAQENVPVVVLKGAAAFLWLYPDAECRELADLDVLIHATDVDTARRILSGLGYAPVESYTSPEEELLGVQAVHLPPYTRAGSLPVEVHVNLVERRGNREHAMADAWSGVCRADIDGIPLGRLCWTHFLLHGMVHYARHLDEDFPSLKGLADLLVLLRQFGPEVDWSMFWDSGRQWEVMPQAGAVGATLAAHWGVSIPGLPGDSIPVPAEVLVNGLENPRSGMWRSGLQRVAAARELPTSGARLRYLFHLVFPTAAHVRWRYSIPEGRPVLPYRLRHASRLAARLFRSLARRDKQ